jgi:hypothetical protein
VHEPGTVYQARLNALPSVTPVADPDGQYVAPDDLTQRIAALAMKPTGDEATRWARYSAEYTIREWGVIDPVDTPDRFSVESGVPYFRANESGTVHRYRLTEIQPGLFLAWNGETLDLRGQQPTWRNFALIRLTGGPAPWQWLLLAASGLVSLWWLGGAILGTIRRRRRAAPAEPATHARWRRVAGFTSGLTAVFALLTIALIAVVPRLVDSGFLGWLELPLALRLILHLPLALAVASGCLAALIVAGWARDWQTPAIQLRYAALAAAGVVLTTQLAFWNLIGWGLS